MIRTYENAETSATYADVARSADLCDNCKNTNKDAIVCGFCKNHDYTCNVTQTPAMQALDRAMQAVSNANDNVIVEGVSPDAPVITNEKGGKQSNSPYCWTDFSPLAMLEIAKRSGYGQKRYGPDNWQKIPWQEHLNHALTHIYCWLAEDKSDTVAGGHPAAAAWRIIEALGVWLKEKAQKNG